MYYIPWVGQVVISGLRPCGSRPLRISRVQARIPRPPASPITALPSPLNGHIQLAAANERIPTRSSHFWHFCPKSSRSSLIGHLPEANCGGLGLVDPVGDMWDEHLKQRHLIPDVPLP